MHAEQGLRGPGVHESLPKVGMRGGRLALWTVAPTGQRTRVTYRARTDPHSAPRHWAPALPSGPRAADAFAVLRAELAGTDRHDWTQLTDVRPWDITAWICTSAATPSPGGHR